jgi:glutaredoxin 3
MSNVIIFSKAQCPYCDRAKALLNQLAISYEEIRVDLDPTQLDEMRAKGKGRTFPQIIIKGEGIGGFDDLYALSQSGKLQELLKK